MSAVVHTITGDWLSHGYINNVNRSRVLDFALVNGRPYALDCHDEPDLDAPIVLTEDGWLQVPGGSFGFSPDTGEAERVGVVFPSDCVHAAGAACQP
jgi:hypothetical protein